MTSIEIESSGAGISRYANSRIAKGFNLLAR
jgi:hypothetical protein